MIKLSLLLGVLMTVSNSTIPTIAPRPAGTQEIVMTQDEARFVELLNEERASRGLSQLTVDPLLVQVGRAHSREMADKHYFSHTSPTSGLEMPSDRYLSAVRKRPSWALVGENLFYCSIVDVDRGHNAFMNSKGHRDNILESRFQRVGVGIYTTPDGQFYVTQMFLAKTD
jgi:uncharacterized protein YkwD